MNELLPVINGMKLVAVIPAFDHSDYVAVARDLETDRFHVVTWWEGKTYWHGVKYDFTNLEAAIDLANAKAIGSVAKTNRKPFLAEHQAIRDLQHVPSPDSSVMKEVV